MKKCLTLVVILLIVSSLRAQEKELKAARERWLHGNYAEARELYEKLLDDPKSKNAALVGLSRAMQSTGEYELALKTIEEALKQGKAAPEVLARQAELLYTLGRRDDALKAAEAALLVDKDQFLARWVRASIWEDRGDIDKADKEYRWFVRTYSERSDKDMDIKDPEQLVLVGLAGCENVRLNIKKDNSLSEQYTFILNEVYGDAIKNDKDYWPAEYQAGMLLLEKYNRGEAAEAFGKALKINPNAAEVHVGRGLAALQKLDIKEAESAAEKALKINSNLPEALQLRADVYLAVGSVDDATKELERARKINPYNEQTLGRLAACQYLLRKKDSFDKLAAEAEKVDPKPGTFYYIVGERLEERRRFEEAEKFYKKAADLRPQMTGPQSALGILYMRVGREQEAQTILDRAFDADPFNVRVSNNLKVLKHLKDYKTLKTEHFELRYDPKNDEVLAGFLGEYLEEVYKDLAGKFQYQPKNPILFEVFRTHEMFSGRVISVPDLHTIGASTGKIVAMASPHAKGLSQAFNWGRVVRHELVHVFNLEQTNFLVPIWFTEGLAVENEGFPRPQLWNQLLLERVPAGNLLNLDTIDMGFMKPASQADWAMAYCQAQLYVQYIKSKSGADAVGKLLDAFREGVAVEAAISRVCRMDKEAFEKGYKEYVSHSVQGIRGKAAEKHMDFKELKDAHADKPNDAEIAGRLAVAYYRRGDRAEARKLAEEVLSKKMNQPKAAWVKARLLDAAGESKEALAMLESAIDEKDPDPLVAAELAKMYFNGKEPAKAVKMYELGRKAEPYDKKWLEGLAKSYADSGEKSKQIEVLKDLVPLDADDLTNRRRLAQLLMEEGKVGEAEKYARQCMEIDVLDRDAQEVLLSALEAQDKKAELAHMKKLFGK
jgi:tetratricopeptide (TPR) repeat protein